MNVKQFKQLVAAIPDSDLYVIFVGEEDGFLVDSVAVDNPQVYYYKGDCPVDEDVTEALIVGGRW